MIAFLFSFFVFQTNIIFANSEFKQEIITFPSDALTLGGVFYKPQGKGPFPAVLYNHGSAPGMLNNQASDILGPLFASHGWIFFMPYRRGQGLSEKAGTYIMDQVEEASKKDGANAASATMIRLLKTDHLNDQLAALTWLRKQKMVAVKKIAVAGNSFGGIEVILGAAHESYCAAVDASGAAQTWSSSSELQGLMKEAVKKSKSPILFFQAENDFDLNPSKVLSAEMKSAGKVAEMKIYPPFGKSNKEGHSFAYLGSSIWGTDIINFLNKYCQK
jgi:carboxymethylenebutenolidase